MDTTQNLSADAAGEVAHLEDLAARGVVAMEGAFGHGARFRMADAR